jgi:HlyD family secretion protein
MSQQPPDSTNQLLTLPGFGDGGDGGDGGNLPGPPPPWWRTRRGIIGIAVVLLVIILGGVLISLLNRPKPITYQRAQATMGDLSLTISATGPVQSGIYNVMFSGTGGLIDQLDVKIGQKVKQGQVLAQLDKTALQDALNQQKAILQTAQGNLASAEANLGAAEAEANANLANAQTGVNNAQSSLGATQSQSQASINQAQQTLNSDQTALNQTRNVENASINSAQQTLNSDQTILNQTRTQANASIQVAFTTEQQALQKCNAGGSSAVVLNAMLIPATPTPAPSPTPTVPVDCVQAAHNAYNQAVAQANLSVKQAQAKVNADQTSLNQTRTTANQMISQAQSKVNDDQKALALAQAQANSSNTTAKNSVSSSQSQLNQTQATSNSSIASQQAQVISDQGIVAQDQVQVDTAQHNLDNATIRAPHDGTVTVINGTVGSAPGVPQNASQASTTASGNTFIQLIDTSNLQVTANVNESDTANLKVGEPATFTVNAYGNQQFQGTVSAISPNGQPVSNVVTYPVTIDIDMTKLNGANLLPGMTASVTITTVDRPNVLLIPVNAVNFARLASSGNSATGTPQLITRADAANAMTQARQMLINLQNQNPAIASESPIPAYVVEQADGKFFAKPVVLGLTDGTVYEVLNGLVPDETVIVGVANGNGGFGGGAGGNGGNGGNGGGGGGGGGVRGG